MSAPLQLSGSIKTKSRVSQWGLLMLLGGLGTIIFLQAKLLWKDGGADTQGSFILQSMQARLSGVSLGIMSYLQNHDPESLTRITSEGKEATRLLADFKVEAAQSENKTIYDRIEKAHEDVREAALNLLAIDHQSTVGRKTFKQSSDMLLSIFSEQIQPSIKSNQLNATARIRAVRAATAEVKNLIQNPSSESLNETGQAQFKKAMAAYEELSRTHRAGRWKQDAMVLFEQCVSQAHDLQKAGEQKQAALDRYHQKRNAFDSVVQQNPLHTPGLKIHSVAQGVSSGLAYVVIAGVLLLAGIIFVLITNHRTETQLVGPLQNILQCVEAASTGDVTRLPEHWSRDEVGQLSQAVGRLITVLARSENLVYHLAALVESSGEAIISHTLDGTILSWNKGAQRTYGYSAEEVKGQSIAILSPQDGGSEMRQYIQRLRKGERLAPFETIHQARNGRSVRAFVRMSAILDSTHKPIGASFCAQELTDTGLLAPKTADHTQIV